MHAIIIITYCSSLRIDIYENILCLKRLVVTHRGTCPSSAQVVSDNL